MRRCPSLIVLLAAGRNLRYPHAGAPDNQGASHGGKYVVRKGNSGKYRFTLTVTNGQVIATSAAEVSKRRALADINSVKKSAPDAAVEDNTRPTDRAATLPLAVPAPPPAARPAGRRSPAFMPLACGYAELRHPHAARGDPHFP